MTDSKCYAAIDIGSNAVRLLIKKVKNNENLANKAPFQSDAPACTSTFRL